MRSSFEVVVSAAKNKNIKGAAAFNELLKEHGWTPQEWIATWFNQPAKPIKKRKKTQICMSGVVDI